MQAESRIKIPNGKGQMLSLAVNYPAKINDLLAILCPGFLDSKDYAHLKNLAEDLSAMGYTVVRLDPTGTWESEGDISEYTVTQYLADINSVWQYMSNKIHIRMFC